MKRKETGLNPESEDWYCEYSVRKGLPAVFGFHAKTIADGCHHSSAIDFIKDVYKFKKKILQDNTVYIAKKQKEL